MIDEMIDQNIILLIFSINFHKTISPRKGSYVLLSGDNISSSNKIE